MWQSGGRQCYIVPTNFREVVLFVQELKWNTRHTVSMMISLCLMSPLNSETIFTPLSWALLKKPPLVQLFKKSPTLYGTRRFIIAFNRARHWSLSWARSIQSIPPHASSLRYILILTSYLLLGLPIDVFPTITLYAFLFLLLKGPDFGVSHSELLVFRTLSTVRCSKNYKRQRFGNWICFHPQVNGETPTLLGPSERANQVQWLKLVLSEGLNWVGVSPFTWGRKQIQFPKRRVFYFLEYRTMDKVRKPRNSNSSSSSCLLHVLPISSSMTWLFQLYLATSTR
jgi:hypothetical protein